MSGDCPCPVCVERRHRERMATLYPETPEDKAQREGRDRMLGMWRSAAGAAVEAAQGEETDDAVTGRKGEA